MSGVDYRSIKREDVPAVIAMLADDPLGATREIFEDPLPECYWQAFAIIEQSDAVDIIIADLDGEVVGCLQFNQHQGLARMGMRRAQIEAVRVKSDKRGLRIGEGLCLSAIARARQSGCGLIELTTDTTRKDAHRFYERLGFAASHVGMKMKLTN